MMDDPAVAHQIKEALAYPGLSAGDLNQSFYYDRNNGAYLNFPLSPANLRIKKTGLARLKDSVAPVPLYDISFEVNDGNRIELKDRIALLGIGSNSSPAVMKRKFNNFAEGDATDFATMPAGLENHAVVHGAFVGGRGPVPLTIHREEGATSSVTIGFYTKEQAEHLTGTEPNYDGLLLEGSVTLPGGATLDNPLAYCSIWGALRNPRENGEPLAHAGVPSTTQYTKMTTPDAIRLAASITSPREEGDWRGHFERAADMTAAETEIFIRGHLDMEGKKEARLERTFRIQESFAIASNVKGVKIFPASIGTELQEKYGRQAPNPHAAPG